MRDLSTGGTPLGARIGDIGRRADRAAALRDRLARRVARRAWAGRALLAAVGLVVMLGGPAYASALAYPDPDLTTVDGVCEIEIEGVIDTAGGTWSTTSGTIVCDVHDDLVNSLMVLSALFSFGIGFAVLTVALR